MRRLHSPGIVLAIALFAGAASTQQVQETSANDLVRRVVANELRAQDEDHSHWMYRLETKDRGKTEIRGIIETRDGDLSRLLCVNDLPLSEDEQRKEDQRIQKLASHASQQQKLQQARNEDGDEARRLLTMLPDALLYSYRESRGDLVRLDFRPNPAFRPPSREAHVFHEMGGEIWVDAKQDRLVKISGRLIHDVRFAGGLLGHLDQGGRFEVMQSEVAPGHWEMTLLDVNMKGRVLLLKTIGVQRRERRSDFRRVPDNLTLAQAADILRRQTLATSNQCV